MTEEPRTGTLLGIDLGTSFSVVAYLNEDGRPETIVNQEGERTTPSVVLIEDGHVTVGREAVKAAAYEPGNVASAFKRDVGKAEFDKAVDGEKYPPEFLQAAVLKKLVEDAERKVGPIAGAVITVPAFFNEARRQATRDAARLAGLDVKGIINEPTAAALVNGMQLGFLSDEGTTKSPEVVVIYDLGGGTFDVTVMRVDEGQFDVLATDGDVRLGGEDWDKKLLDMVADAFEKKHRGLDPRSDATAYARLHREVVEAKLALSARERAAVHVEVAGESERISVTRDEFDALGAGLLERTRFTLESVVKEAGLTWDEVTRVLLVGGSTRIPAVTRMVESVSGKTADVSLSADEAVAHGAAIYASLQGQSGRRRKNILSDVLSHSLGVVARDRRTHKRVNVTVLKRNVPLPSSSSQKFRTAKDDSREVVVKVVEGDDPDPAECKLLGEVRVTDLPAGLSRGTHVIVEFSASETGEVCLSAVVDGTGKVGTATIQRTEKMPDNRAKLWSDRLNLT